MLTLDLEDMMVEVFACPPDLATHTTPAGCYLDLDDGFPILVHSEGPLREGAMFLVDDLLCVVSSGRGGWTVLPVEN